MDWNKFKQDITNIFKKSDFKDFEERGADVFKSKIKSAVDNKNTSIIVFHQE